MSKCKSIPANDTALLNGKESAEQIELISWWDNEVCQKNLKYWSKCLYHIPNGGSRNVVEARNLKRQGVRKGTPDLHLCIPSGNYHGLFIEMKRAVGGIVSQEQIEFINKVRALGYAAYVCHGAMNAKHLITDYLSGKELPDNLIYELPNVVGDFVI